MILKSHEVELNNFDEYQAYVSQISTQHEALCKKTSELKYYPPLFRGHRDSVWTLGTTLERAGFKDFPFINYALKVEATRSKIETLIGKKWDYRLNDLNLSKASAPIDLLPNPKLHHLFELFAYLRHHAFPSPLLDWTVSPYVAAFFAFDYVGIKASASSKVAIYCYVETNNGSKIGEDNQGMIWSIGPNLVAHKRHFLQQCRYTVCLKRQDESYVFGNHEESIDPENPDQDILIKMVLPFSVRHEVISRLKLMNIGPYQLFENEDSLVRSMAYEAFARE